MDPRDTRNCSQVLRWTSAIHFAELLLRVQVFAVKIGLDEDEFDSHRAHSLAATVGTKAPAFARTLERPDHG